MRILRGLRIPQGLAAGIVLVAMLRFESTGHALAVPAVYLAVTSLEGQLIAPMILGKRFSLNPVAIFTWLIFRGWIGGGTVGTLPAVPRLTILKIVCDAIEPPEPFGRLIGREGAIWSVAFD